MEERGHSVDVWYSKAVEKIRVDSTPGGIALPIEKAEAFRDELDDAIEEARADAADAQEVEQ